MATVVRDWGLDLGDPYPDCGVSWVAPAERRGVALVLKVQYPHREAEGEADALRAWDGRGAIRLVDLARRFLDGLRREPGPPVLVHQDLHGDNVLAARRRPWLAIDPKPRTGEREFSVAPVVRSFEFGHSRDAVTQRLARLGVELGLDEERAARWTVAQTVAWSFDSAFAERHLETAGWLADHLGEPFDRSRG